MKTVSINVMNLCVPCENRCRYCLLSWDGRLTGADYERSRDYALRFYRWLRENRPELSFLFGFGYSMEHPRLMEAIRFCQSIGSATGEFLQFDGMKFRTDPELLALLTQLKAAGIRLLDLTFYGTEEYHDRFAARAGDYDLMLRTLAAANSMGLEVTVSIPMTGENAGQIQPLLAELDQYRTKNVRLFIPHSEGRGRLLDPVRLTLPEFEALDPRVKSLLNRERYRTEGEWVLTGGGTPPEKRVLTLTLTRENMDRFEAMDFAGTISYLEGLDDAYYEAVPSFAALLKQYGDPRGQRMFSSRDLYLQLQRRFLEEQGLELYDVNDERQCFSRRF